MKTFLALVMLFHGLIHLMGFAKAFGLAKIDRLTVNIPWSLGLSWLLATLVFSISAIALLLKKEWWPTLAILAVAISQILIIIYWKDAKYGTVANLLILLVSIPSYGSYRFQSRSLKAARTQWVQKIPKNTSVIYLQDLAHMPPIVQKWVLASGVVGHQKPTTAHIEQKGRMKTDPDGRWMPFTAEQYVNTRSPGFVWIAKVRSFPFIYLDGRDKLENGKGEMLIKLSGLFPVVDVQPDDKINSAAMQRYLAEISWFPSAALNENIVWEAVDSLSARATISTENLKVSGIFTFNSEGGMVSFETERYFGNDADARLEKWFIEALEYKEFQNFTIPSKCKVSWKLQEGDFTWLDLEIDDVYYYPNLSTVPDR
ncbi:DUF6544 family protein [Flavobacteriaceae bacterium 3-367]|uniref:DUF6544 family protein n=1 Tax=Eudoraea algarum TaxID=3417568 RepID=UPI00328232E7